MIEFDEKDLRELQDVDGIVLQDVHGKRVAIGKGLDYENFFQFMSAYFDEYGADDCAKKLGYKDDVDMFKSWQSGLPFHESNLGILVCLAFHGISADSFKEKCDYENENRLEAEKEH